MTAATNSVLRYARYEISAWLHKILRRRVTHRGWLGVKPPAAPAAGQVIEELAERPDVFARWMAREINTLVWVEFTERLVRHSEAAFNSLGRFTLQNDGSVSFLPSVRFSQQEWPYCAYDDVAGEPADDRTSWSAEDQAALRICAGLLGAAKGSPELSVSEAGSNEESVDSVSVATAILSRWIPRFLADFTLPDTTGHDALRLQVLSSGLAHLGYAVFCLAAANIAHSDSYYIPAVGTLLRDAFVPSEDLKELLLANGHAPAASQP